MEGKRGVLLCRNSRLTINID